MKNKIKDKLNIGTAFSALIIIVCVSVLAGNFPLCKSIIGKAAALSAKTVLVTTGERKTDKKETVKKGEEENIADVSESAGDSNEPESETATEKKTEKEAAKNEKKNDTSVSSLIDGDFTKEPADIAALTAKCAENAGKDKKDGNITELTYTTSGVTDKYQNVRVKNINDTRIDIEKLLSEKPDITVQDKSQPTVLIFHTHTTESYQILDRSFYARDYITRSEDSSRNMIRVGDAICTQLEKAGFSVIHDTNIYDRKYNGAYDRSRVQVQKYLKEYPSVQVVLDIHRDAIEYNDGTKVKPVTEIMGKKCAQMMIISGCQEKGNGITDFEDWRYNLVFAVHLQKTLEDMFEGITRPLYFCPRRYIMNESHCNLLIEMGSDANTLSEGVFAGKCLGTALAAMLEEYST